MSEIFEGQGGAGGISHKRSAVAELAHQAGAVLAEGILRLSAGIEDPADLCAGLEQALEGK